MYNVNAPHFYIKNDRVWHSALPFKLEKRKLVALGFFFLSYRCIVTINVIWLFLTVPWVGLQYVIVLFTDHTHLFFETIGVSDSLLLWFKNYLADQKQRVVLPGAAFSWKSIKAGVPHGSILDPLLFLIYINEPVHEISNNMACETGKASDQPAHTRSLIRAFVSRLNIL